MAPILPSPILSTLRCTQAPVPLAETRAMQAPLALALAVPLRKWRIDLRITRDTVILTRAYTIIEKPAPKRESSTSIAFSP